MTSNRFIQLCNECADILRKRSPYKTGNLRLNAIKIEFSNADTCRIYVDENVAPYMLYTNEEWINRSGDNPNEGWFDDAAQEIVQYLANKLQGEIKS